MVFQIGQNSYDITYICVSAAGIFSLASYIGFIYISTHNGDFYRIRRWKAASWVSIIPSIILLVFLLFVSTKSVLNNSPAQSIFELLGLIVGIFFSTIALITPFTFVFTLGTHYQLKWWPSSETYLNKIWEDPNKKHKSPIQDI